MQFHIDIDEISWLCGDEWQMLDDALAHCLLNSQVVAWNYFPTPTHMLAHNEQHQHQCMTRIHNAHMQIIVVLSNLISKRTWHISAYVCIIYSIFAYIINEWWTQEHNERKYNNFTVYWILLFDHHRVWSIRFAVCHDYHFLFFHPMQMQTMMMHILLYV